ncbi:hypothetical protein BpHYR1_002962 [Brachionus plicatilis]|uniref:Endonuclease/exonuclease/phosphatase domain-containing protein n=1 Tax=Brachionus plicatilis TaxID=10195 RepID=A0A3M7PWI9_BRAPC|nr:hypothetical protein BpHYR1_002962 [Brachionus plicatilis]
MPNPPQVEQMKIHNLHLKQIRAILLINSYDLASSRYHKNTPLYQSDMPDYLGKSSGRPYGGQCWFLDDSCDLIESDFFNRHSSYVHLKIKGQEFNKVDSIALYETTLSILIAHMKFFKNKNIPMFIIGDLNADPFRLTCQKSSNINKLDTLLYNFIHDNDLVLLDSLNTQFTSYTYTNDLGNLSDHLAIKLDVTYENLHCETESLYFKPQVQPRLKLEISEVFEFYNNNLSYHFFNSCLDYTDRSKPIFNAQEHVDIFYKSDLI